MSNVGRLCTLSLQTSVLQTPGTKPLHLPCSTGQECTGGSAELTALGAHPAQPRQRPSWLLSLSHSRCLSQLWGHRGCCPALPCSLPRSCSRRSVCCRWIAQLWGSGKQLLPHTCQQGELSRDLLCSKGPGAAACPSTVQGPPRGCSLCSGRGSRAA